MKILCDYCSKPTNRVSGETMYPHLPKLHNKIFWKCISCDAHVGCHPGTDKPLGRLAKKELRQLRMKAHSSFDLVRDRLRLSRRGTYKWLADKMDIPEDECHMGMFNEVQCRVVVRICGYHREQTDKEKQASYAIEEEQRSLHEIAGEE